MCALGFPHLPWTRQWRCLPPLKFTWQGKQLIFLFYFCLGLGIFVVVTNAFWILIICLLIWECFRLTFPSLSLLPQRLETFLFFFFSFLSIRQHCHLITILKEMELWENHQIWQDSSSRHWWWICSLHGAPMFSDSPWRGAPPSPLPHLRGPNLPREQEPHLRPVLAVILSYQSPTLLLQPRLQLTSLPARCRMAEVHGKRKN